MSELTEQQKLQRIQLDADTREVMSTPTGRRFVNHAVELCHIMKLSFSGNSQTFFLEGERNIGIQLYADINRACPELWDEMRAEDRDRKQQIMQRLENKKGSTNG